MLCMYIAMYITIVLTFYNYCLWWSLGWTGVLVACGESYNVTVN